MIETDILECLRRIEDAVSSDKFEHLGIWTLGGPNGTYIMKSPVNTESEWALFGVSFTAAGNVLISMNPGASNPLAINGSVSYGAGGGNESNPVEGLFITAAAATTFQPMTETFWQPTGRGSSVYALISGLAGGQSGFALIAWRRLLNREIPAPPRRPPVTHSNRISNRPQRVLPAMSPETANAIEGRTAIPGGGFYRHVVSPGEEHDPAAIARGIAAPLTPAQVAMAKLRGKGGTY